MAAVVGLSTWMAGNAAANGEVNIYSYRQPFLIKPMLNAFTHQTGIKTNVVFAPKGMITRLQREGKNSPADVILTVDIGADQRRRRRRRSAIRQDRETHGERSLARPGPVGPVVRTHETRPRRLCLQGEGEAG